MIRSGAGGRKQHCGGPYVDLLFRTVRDLSRWIYVIGGVFVVFIMLLTVADVILRYLGRPILGAYELVAFSGAVVLGFSLPYTSLVKGHIYVDVLVSRFPPGWKVLFNALTRAAGLCLLTMMGWSLFEHGSHLRKSGEVSLTIQIPFYPIAFGIGVCCLVTGLVLACDMIKILRGEYE